MDTTPHSDNTSDAGYRRVGIGVLLFGLVIIATPALLDAGNSAMDPGADPKATPRAGGCLPGLSAEELTLFTAGVNDSKGSGSHFSAEAKCLE